MVMMFGDGHAVWRWYAVWRWLWCLEMVM